MAPKTYALFITLKIFLLIFFFLKPVLGQELAPATLTELKAILNAEMQKQHIAGMALTIVNRDSILFAGGIGYSDIEKKTQVSDKHLFRGASITKIFVALGIMDLVKNGKLSVKTRLKDIAPEIPFENKWEATHPVTVEQLMEHTTGFSDKSPFEEYNFTGSAYPGISAVRIFRHFMVSKWKPGQRHSYSSVNYAILDYIIEKVSGQPTGKYLQQRVFKPLGMPYANIELTSDGSGNYSNGYVWKGGQFQSVPHQPAFNTGYSSLNISALDFASALKTYLNNWKTASGQFLSTEILGATETPHTYLSARAGLKDTYAYGNEAIDLGGFMFRGHRGAIGGFLSAFLYNRQLRLGYAFAINTHNDAFYQFADHLISEFVLRNSQKSASAPAFSLNSAAVKPFVGYYKLGNASQLYTGFLEQLTNTIRIEPAANELHVKILGLGSMIWQPADKAGLKYKNQFAATPRISFLKDADNNPVVVDGTLYFERITLLAAWSPIVLFLSSVLVLLSALFFGMTNAVLFIMKKLSASQLLIRILPLLAAIAFILMVFPAVRLFDHMREATPMDGLFISWSVGKWLFALSTALIVPLLVVRWKLMNSKGLKIYLALTAFSCCYLFIIFCMNGWF